MAKTKVTSTAYGTSQQIAQTYMAAHILTEMLDTSGGGGSGLVTMERVDDVERHYDVTTANTSGSDFSRTKYGRIFLQLEKKVVEYI